MSLVIYEDVEQGSSEWHEARRGIVTASEVHKLVTAKTLAVANNDTSRGYIATLAAERLTGRVEDTGTSWQMTRGTLDEPLAKEAYAEAYEPVHDVGFMVRDFDGVKIGFSPDGLVGEPGFVEVKSRSPKIHITHVLADKVPAGNFAQIQTGLLVSGREWCDYIFYIDSSL